MKKKSILSNKLSLTPTSSVPTAGVIPSNHALSTPSSLTQQGYVKKKGCGCRKK
ncbi:hypothetical protein [Bacillus cereus]